MNEFPSKIVSVRHKHFIAILMEKHLGEKFLNDCIDEAIQRETLPNEYPEKKDKTIKSIALRLL